MKFLLYRFLILIQFIDIFNKCSEKSLLKKLIKKSRSNNNQLIKPRISIILPIYNSEKYLFDCLNNLLNQTLENIEIICIDYGSTDNSLIILKQYEKIDKRIILFHQYNENYNEIIQNAINIAKGDYYMFIYIGIFFSKDFLYDIIKKADMFNPDIIIYGFEKYNQILGKYLYENFSFQKKIWSNKSFNFYSNPNKIFTSFYPFLWNKVFLNTFIKKNNIYFLDKIEKIDLFFTSVSLIMAKKIYLLEKYLIYYQEDLINKNQKDNYFNSFNFYNKLLELKYFVEKNNFPLEKNFKKFAKKTCIYYLKNNKEQNILLYEGLKNNIFEKLGIDMIASDLISQDFYENYLNNLYFKHINLINEKFEVNIIKNSSYLFDPKVSVIIPIYNIEKYIIQCLNSIIKQKLKEIEIIVVNDGSSDNSLQIALNFSKNDNRVIILSQINRGLSEARNTGVKYSKGKYIYFIDGDDYLDENCLLDLYNQAIKNNLDIIFFNAEPFLDDLKEKININLMNIFNDYLLYYKRKGNYEGVLNGTEIFSKMIEENDYLSSACLQFIKKEFYINEGLSFYPGILHEDNLFTFIAILLAKRTSYIKNIYYKRRIHIDSIMTTSFNVKNLYGYFIVYCELIKFLQKNNFEGKERTAIQKEMKKIRNKIEYIYEQITNDEKYILFKKLTMYQEIIFNNILEIIQNNKEIRRMKRIIKKTNKEKKLVIIFLGLFLINISIFLFIKTKKIK